MRLPIKILHGDYIHRINLANRESSPLPLARTTTAAKTASADAGTASHRELRLRVYVGSVIAMGPGKADLLSAIEATGSISAAARELGMSYKRCWDLVSIMNEQFKAPLVLSVKAFRSLSARLLTRQRSNSSI